MLTSLRLRSAVALLVVGWLILCSPWFLEKRTVPWDSKGEFYPNLYFIGESIRSGTAPLWNPYSFSGHPLVSDPQSMLFSPLAVALMAVVDKPSVYWFDAVEFLHLLLGGLGMLLLAVHFGRTPIAGLFAAAVYMFGGPAASRLQHVPIILAYSYFPLALLTLDLALKSKRVVWGICFGVVGGIMAAHQVQVAYLLSLVLIGYVFHEAFSSDSIRKFFADRWRALLAAICVGMLTIAIPLLATLQFLPMSTRPGFSYERAVQNSLHPLTLATLLVHDFFGTAHTTTNWAPGDSTESFLYVGALPIVLFLLYGVATGAVFERPFRYFFGVGVFGVLYALGRFTPFYWLAYHVLPGVNLFQRPPDGEFLVNMVLAMGASFLIDRLFLGTLPKVRLSLLLPISIAAVVLLALGLRFAAEAGKAARLGKEYSLAILFMVLSAGLLYAISRARPATRRLLILLGIVLLATDMRVHNVGTELNTYPLDWAPRYIESLDDKHPFMKLLKDGLNSGDGGPYRVEFSFAEAFWESAPMVAGIQATKGSNPMRYALYDEAFDPRGFYNTPRSFTPLMPSYSSPLFNLLGVKYIASIRALRELDPKADESRFKLVYDQGFKVWQNSDVLPRVLTPTSVRIDANPERAIKETGMPALDYRSVVVLTRLPRALAGLRTDGDQPALLPGSGDAIAEIQAYGSSEIVIRAQSSRDTIVVLNDLYYPYWRVYVDKQEQELLRANYIFRGVHLGPGQHEVVFRFEPFSRDAIQSTVGLAPGE